MVGWHHWLNGHEFDQTLGDSEGKGGLMCCSPWSHRESEMTQQTQEQAWDLLIFCLSKQLTSIFHESFMPRQMWQHFKSRSSYSYTSIRYQNLLLNRGTYNPMNSTFILGVTSKATGILKFLYLIPVRTKMPV